MPMAGEVHTELDVRKLAHTLTLKVKLRRHAEFKLRAWIGMQLIRLAAWVMWLGVEFEGLE